MTVTDAQVRKFMEEMSKHGQIGKASMKAGFDRATGRKYRDLGKMPSQVAGKLRDWKTRADPFEEDWPEMEDMLEKAPTLEGKALFGWLMKKHPGKYDPGQVRTFQRRVKQWRAMKGPDKEVFFGQQHRPGEAMQTDFTWATILGVTICGVAFPHMLCHMVLPFSNWEWATVCRSESMAAIKRGIQAALFVLERVPEFSQTDNSTAATHDLRTGKRGFNDEYAKFCGHFGMTPRTIGVGKSNQNGDVESGNGAMKRNIEQHLLLRGSRDFDSVEEYESWVQGILRETNVMRCKKVKEELAAMKPLRVDRLPEYKTKQVRVTSRSTIRINHNTYSLPSRLTREKVKVRIYEDRLEVFYGGTHQLTMERLLGRNGHRIDYRHIIWSLVKKPGAFPHYVYRDDLFPSLLFRRAYDVLCEEFGHGRKADLHYLRILHQAAAVSESEVEAALGLIMEAKVTPDADRVKELVQPKQPEVPEMARYVVDLGEYDGLLEAKREAQS